MSVGRFYAMIGALVTLFILSVQLLGTVKTEFFPLGDRNQFLVYLDFEAGTDVRNPLYRWTALASIQIVFFLTVVRILAERRRRGRSTSARETARAA